MTKRTFEPSSDNINDVSKISEPKSSVDRAAWNRADPANQAHEAQKDEPSLWDDPDLVPVPVLPAFSDNSVNYEVHNNGENSLQTQELRQVPPSAHGNQPYFGHSIAQTDHTIAGL